MCIASFEFTPADKSTSALACLHNREEKRRERVGGGGQERKKSERETTFLICDPSLYHRNRNRRHVSLKLAQFSFLNLFKQFKLLMYSKNATGIKEHNKSFFFFQVFFSHFYSFMFHLFMRSALLPSSDMVLQLYELRLWVFYFPVLLCPFGLD